MIQEEIGLMLGRRVTKGKPGWPSKAAVEEINVVRPYFSAHFIKLIELGPF